MDIEAGSHRLRRLDGSGLLLGAGFLGIHVLKDVGVIGSDPLHAPTYTTVLGWIFWASVLTFALALVATWRPHVLHFDAEGFRLESRLASRQAAWSDVAWVGAEGANTWAFDTRGRVLAHVTTLTQSGRLVAERFRAVAQSVAPERAAAARRATYRRTGMGLGILAIAFLGVAAMLVVLQVRARDVERLLPTAVIVDAPIVARWERWGGLLGTLEYALPAADGSTVTRRAKLDGAVWREVAGSSTIPVHYIPSRPSVSALVGHQHWPPMDSDEYYGAYPVLLLLGGALGVVSVVYLSGRSSWFLTPASVATADPVAG